MMSMSRTELEEDTLHWGLVSQENMLFHKEILEVCVNSWLHGSINMIGSAAIRVKQFERPEAALEQYGSAAGLKE
jgi:hypothetical protein